MICLLGNANCHYVTQASWKLGCFMVNKTNEYAFVTCDKFKTPCRVDRVNLGWDHNKSSLKISLRFFCPYNAYMRKPESVRKFIANRGRE